MKMSLSNSVVTLKIEYDEVTGKIEMDLPLSKDNLNHLLKGQNITIIINESNNKINPTIRLSLKEDIEN